MVLLRSRLTTRGTPYTSKRTWGTFLCKAAEAAKEGDYNQFVRLLKRRGDTVDLRVHQLLPCLRIALSSGHGGMVHRLLAEGHLARDTLARVFAWADEPRLMGVLIDAGEHIPELARVLASMGKAECLSLVLDKGGPWEPYGLVSAAEQCRMDILDIVLQHSRDWHPHLAVTAAADGNLRFLARVLDEGCPLWTSALDGEPFGPAFWCYSEGCYSEVEGKPRPRFQVPFGCLVLPSDLAVSGPVLLFAERIKAPLTHRMRGMLAEVRRRAAAVAGCFHLASRLAEAQGDCRATPSEAVDEVPSEVGGRDECLAAPPHGPALRKRACTSEASPRAPKRSKTGCAPMHFPVQSQAGPPPAPTRRKRAHWSAEPSGGQNLGLCRTGRKDRGSVPGPAPSPPTVERSKRARRAFSVGGVEGVWEVAQLAHPLSIMGRIPVDIVMRIATLARVSIACPDLLP